MEESKNPSLSQSELTELKMLIERLHKLFIASLDAKAFDLYIEPQVKDCETGVEYSAFARLTDFITDPNAASLLLAGDPGMGKTLLSRQIAQQAWYLFIRENLGGLLGADNPYWQAVLDQGKAIEVKKDKDKDKQKSFKAEHCLPLWLWMPFLRSESNWREELLETHFKQIYLLPTEIQLLKKACQLRICRLLPIMDGWGELPPGVVTNNLYLKSQFWEETGWPYLKVFSTCRPEAFIHYEKSQGDYRSIFDPKQGAAGSYTILNLSLFEPRHVKDYVERSLSPSERTQLETLIERLHGLFIARLDAKAFDLYIEPQVKDRQTGVEDSAFARLINFITDPGAASLLLAGDPGMGKTLLSLQIAQQSWYLFIRENLGGLLRAENPYWQAVLDQGRAIEVKDEEKSFKAEYCLPLWLWMPFLRSESNWKTELLETHFKQIHLLPTEIQLLKKACQLKICRLFPVMDGWDELPPGVVTENLYLKSGFWEEKGWPYLKVFSTCRPEAFIHYEKKTGDYRSIFDPKQGTAGSYTILNLSPFEPRHIRNYVECYLSTLPPDYTPSISEVSDPAVEQGHFDKAKQAWLEDYQKYTIDPAILKQPLPSQKEVDAEQLPAESQEILQRSSQLKPLSSQVKQQDPTDSKKETIAVPGDSHCAFYAIGIGLIENIYDGSLQLDTIQHTTFLVMFGLGILKFDRDASEFSVDEFKEWVKKSYTTRDEFTTYQIFKGPLRLLASTLLQEKWKEGSLPKKLCDELVAMAKQAKDTKTNQLDVENFKAIFAASHLKEGAFGKALKTKLDEMTDPIGSKAWEQNLLTWLSTQETQNLYTDGVMNDAWASRDIELPLLGHYFGISIYVDNKPIYQAKNHAEIGLVMQHGIHYDYQTKLSRLTAQRAAVLEMIQMGRGKANPILEKKLKYLDQAIASVEFFHPTLLKQEGAEESDEGDEEYEGNEGDEEDEEKVDDEDLPEEESKSKQIPDILPKPQSSQPDIVDWRSLDIYLHYLEQIRGLSELVKTPFILSAVVQVLPTIVLHEQRNPNSDISRYMIYQYFVDHWLTKQAERLWSDPEKRANLPEFRAATKEDSITKLKACLLTYSENLARLALNLGKGKINVDLSEEDTSHASLVIPSPGQPSYFKEEAVEKNKIQLIRSGCLLKNIDHHFKFLHKSLVEYFAAKMLFSGAHVVVAYYLNRFDENQTFKDLDLNDHLLTAEPSVVYLLADKVKEDIHFKYLLYQMIELSKGEPSVSNAAANAITILNAAGESFSRRDFRGVNIPGAILNGALCESTDFEGADLSSITAQNACFASANLSHAQTNGLDFRELPRIKHTNKIATLCMAPNGEWLLVGDVKGYVTQYSYPEGKRLQQWHRKAQEVLEEDDFLGNVVLLLSGEKNSVESLALHPDGKLAACGGFDGTIQLIHIQQNRLGARLVPAVISKTKSRVKIRASLGITFCSTAGRYFAFSSRINSIFHLQIWDVGQQRFLGEYQSSERKRIETLMTCNQGNTLLAKEDKQILFFFITQYMGGDLIPAQTLDCEGHFIPSQDGRLLALAQEQENVIHLYQTCDWLPPNTITLRNKPKKVEALAFSHKGNLLAIQSELQLHFWDLLSGQHLYAIPIPEKKDNSNMMLDFVPIADKLQVLLSVKDMLYFWSLMRAGMSIAYPRHPINLSARFLEKTEFLGSIDTDTLSIQSNESEGIILKVTLSIHDKITQQIYCLSYNRSPLKTDGLYPQMLLSPNKNYLVTRASGVGYTDDYGYFELAMPSIASMLQDTKICIWNLKQKRLSWTINHPVVCKKIMFSIDGQWLVHGAKDVFIHRLADGKQLLKLTTGNFVTALVLSADKSWLVVADLGGSLSIFDVKTKKRVYCLSNLPIVIWDLDLTVDSQFLVAKGKKEGALTFRVLQERGIMSLNLIHSSMELNLVCADIKIEATRGLSQANLQLLQQNNAQGTPALPSPENHPDAPQSTESPLPQELTFDRAVVKRSSVTSFLNPRAVLDYSLWQVGLVRDKASKNNREHTFIVVEGMDAFGRCFFWRFDLATKTGEEKVKEGFAKVIIKEQKNIILSEREEVLGNFLNPHALPGRGLESLVGHVWQLKREVVLQLYQDVKQDAAQGLLPYAQTGSQSFFGGNGDSCYSWARRRLLALKQEKIEKQLPSKITDYLAMVPRWNLTRPLQEQPAAPPGSGMFSS